MTDEELNARFAVMTSVVTQVANAQLTIQEQVARSLTKGAGRT